MKIAKEGRVFVYPLLFLTMILTFVSSLYNINSIFTVVSGFLFLFCLNFFRDPIRIMPDGERIIVSPSDGKIIRIEKLHSYSVLSNHKHEILSC